MKRLIPVLLVFLTFEVHALEWQPASGGHVPALAPSAGYEADGTPLYIIRAPFQGGISIGKDNPTHTSGYISYGGKENPVSQYEVYTGGGHWVAGQAGIVPPGAIAGGNEADGTPLYIIRAPFEGGLVPGKYNPQYRTGYIPYGGKEQELRSFEFLVSDWQPLRGTNVPPDAFQAGRESNGAPLYIIRAQYGNDLQIGKLNPEYGTGYLAYAGREVEIKSGMEIFTGSGIWIQATANQIPFGAIPGGTGENGSPIFIIRAAVAGGIHPGQLNAQTHRAVVSYGGKELLVREFEVLCYDFHGKVQSPQSVAMMPPQTTPQQPQEPPRPQLAPPRQAANQPSIFYAGPGGSSDQKSLRSDRSVELVVRNAFNRPILLNWVDFQGREKFYARIAPGQVYTQQTYETHVWAVRFDNSPSWIWLVMGPQPRQEITMDRGIIPK